MEPRLFSRGKPVHRHAPASSNQSLQWSHGFSAVESSTLRYRTGVSLRRFNGATAEKPWKVGISRRLGCVLHRFNGATAFQPWKGHGGNPLLRHHVSLQWSHGFSAVERLAATGPSNLRAPLQWSHGFSAVERVASRSESTSFFSASMEPRLFSRGKSTKIQLQHWKLLR